MRKTIVAAVTALTIAGLGARAVIAEAQPAAPPAGPGFDQQRAPGFDGPRGPHPHWGGWMHRMHEGRGPMGGPGTLALVYRHADRQLTAPDVQTLAQAFLLWNGNHTWKVVDVAPASDGAIGFAYATKEGSVIARFTMDPHSGKVTRVE